MTPAPVVQSLPGALLCVCVCVGFCFAWEQAFCVPEPKTTPTIICVMYDAPSSENKSSDELECFGNMTTAGLVLPETLLELTCEITLVSHFKMGSSFRSIIDKIYGSKMWNKAAMTASIDSKLHVVTTQSE